MNAFTFKRELWIGITLFLLATFLPLVLWCKQNLGTEAAYLHMVQLNGFCLAACGIIVAQRWIKRASAKSQESVGVAAMFCATAAFAIAAVNNASAHPSFDYQCIQNGATNILNGVMPYGESTGYVLYPPLYAQAMAWLFHGVTYVAGKLHWHPSSAQTFTTLFYLFQSAQSLAVVALLYLCNRFISIASALHGLRAATLSCAMVALSYPVFGTIQWNQVNLYLTCLILFAMINVQKLPIRSAAALALGVHLKGYPILFLPALLLFRRWKASLWTVVLTIALGFLTMSGFGGKIWDTYFQTANGFIAAISSKPPSYMIDGSNLFSCIFSGWRTIQLLTDTVAPIDAHKVFEIASALRIALGAWFAVRIFARHFGAKHAMHVESLGGTSFVRTSAFYDDVSDLLSFGLLAGPTTLNHHYVMAIPIILWTVCKNGSIKPFQILLGCVMMLNFQSRLANLMTFAPVGLILLAHARAACTRCGLALANKANQTAQQHVTSELKEPVGKWQ